jgi:hypothetical protein
MAKAVIIIKVDPNKRTIARMPMIPSIKGIRTLITTSKVGWRKLLEDVNGEILLCASKVDRDRGKADKEWRIRGGENTAGIGILFGTLDKKLDGMWHCPVDVAWVEARIVWCEPGEDAPAAEIAEVQGIPLFEGDPSSAEKAEGAHLEAEEESAGGAPDRGREAPRVANDVEMEDRPGS